MREYCDGLIEYIKQDVIPNVTDTTTKIGLTILVKQIQKNPEALHRLVKHDTVRMVIGDDIGEFLNTVQDSVKEYGRFEITIPKIPLILNTEQKMYFNADDVERLKRHIIR